MRARRDIAVADPASWQAVVPAVEAAIAACGPAPRLAVAFPALVDARARRVVSTPRGKYVDAVDFDFGAWGARLGVDLRLDTDGRLALLGERAAGALQGVDDAVMLTIGTGIGSAVLSGGVLLRGRGAAGVLAGHLSHAVGGPQCICGSVGCTEAYASGWALPALAAGHPGFGASALRHAAALDFATLFRLADAGDGLAATLRTQVIDHWSVAVLNAVHAYDPAVVVLGGGALAAAASILPPIRQFVDTHAWRHGAPVAIVAATCGSDAALLGAPLLWDEGR